MIDQKCRAAVEINPSESGKMWRTLVCIQIHYSDGRVIATPPSYEFDRDSIVPNLDEPWPSLGHDRLWGTRKWDDGRPVGFLESNRCYHDIIIATGSKKDIRRAGVYYYGLCALGYPAWLYGKLHGREPIYVPSPRECVVHIFITAGQHQVVDDGLISRCKIPCLA